MTERDLSTVPLSELRAEINRRVAREFGAKSGASRRKLRPCPKCGMEFGAKDLRLHLPRCEGETT